MRFKFLIVFVLILLGGCVTSLNPIQKESQRIKDPSLAGVYVGPEDERFIVLPPDGAALYKVIVVDDENTAAVFEAALTKIEDKHYLDFYPLSRRGATANEFLAIHHGAWHTFYQVDLKSDGIEVRVPDPQWLISHVEENPSTLLTQMSQGARILAPTDELRDFIAKYDDLFQSEPRFYKRANIHRKN